MACKFSGMGVLLTILIGGELCTSCTVTGGSLGSVSGTAVVVADPLLPVKGTIEFRVDEVLCEGWGSDLFTGVTEDGVFSSVLTSAGLKDLLHTLDPRYPVPGRASIHKELDKILIKLKAKMSVHVQSACPMQSVSAVTSGPRRGYLPPILELLRTFFRDVTVVAT